MLKQLLQQLLNTRTTPGGAAHSASSTYTSPQWFNGTSTVGDKWTNGLYTGTAPNDGYLNISGSAYITTENVGSMIQAKIGDGQISQVSPMSGQGFNMLFPISKGASFSVNGIRLTDITVRFFKTIGGGYNLLVWRALSCLRALSNYLQRGFCKINIQTLPINAAQVQQLRINRSLEVANKTSLLHFVVGLYFRLAEIMHLPISGSGLKTPQERLATYQTRLLLGSGLQFQSKKATPSSLILVLTQALEILSSFVTNRLNNFASGGASC